MLATHGGPGSPIACARTWDVVHASTPLPEVTNSTIGNDLRIRIYAASSGGDEMRLDRAAVRFSASGHTWTLNEVRLNDRADGASANSPWLLAFADGVELQTEKWDNSFAADRYLELRFPPNHVPAAAVVNGATLTHRFRPEAAGQEFCYWMEIYSGSQVIGTHGSAAAPLACNAGGSPVTETTNLPEIDAGANADDLAVRIYGRSSAKKTSLHDLIRLDIDYMVPGTVCADPGSVTLHATRDSWIDEDKPTDNHGDDKDLKVKTKDGTVTDRNKRTLVGFQLPAIPDGCTLKAAGLRLFQNSNKAGSRPLEALRITGAWDENGVTWANQPPTAGAAATTTAGSGWREWDVVAQVDAMYSTANEGFLIRDAVESSNANDEQRFDSRSEPGRPELVLQFDD